LDGHRLSDFSEGALVSCAKGSLAKGGWMDGWTDSEAAFFFYWRNVAKKRKKIRKYSDFGGFSSPEVRFFFFFGVQIARFQ